MDGSELITSLPGSIKTASGPIQFPPGPLGSEPAPHSAGAERERFGVERGRLGVRGHEEVARVGVRGVGRGPVRGVRGGGGRGRTFAAFMISSARHSAIVLMLRKEDSRAPVVRPLVLPGLPPSMADRQLAI